MRKPLEFSAHPAGFPAWPMYRAYCLHVVDGDTIDVMVDLGLYQYTYVAIRIADINTPELYSSDATERERARAARSYLMDLVLDRPVLITTAKDKQSFGRFVADVTCFFDADVTRSVADMLVAAGHATRVTA